MAETHKDGAHREVDEYVRQLRDFCALLATAFVLSGAVAVATLVVSARRRWFPWMAFAFGVAVAFGALNLFVRRNWLGPRWKRCRIERRLRALPEGLRSRERR